MHENEQVLAALDGATRIHFGFCNFISFRKPADCPTCRDYFITDQMSVSEIMTILNIRDKAGIV